MHDMLSKKINTNVLLEPALGRYMTTKNTDYADAIMTTEINDNILICGCIVVTFYVPFFGKPAYVTSPASMFRDVQVLRRGVVQRA